MDEHVVHIDDQPSFVDEVLEGMVHVRLEGGGGIAKPEEHDCRFVEAEGGREGRFPAIFRADKDIIVSPSDVEFGKDLATL